jgi:hypothetical protein
MIFCARGKFWEKSPTLIHPPSKCGRCVQHTSHQLSMYLFLQPSCWYFHLLCMKFHPCIQDVLSLLALESFLSSSSMRQLLVQVSHNLLISSSFGHSLLLLFFFLLRVEFSRKWFLLLVSQSLLIVSSILQLSFHNYPIHFLVFFACL